ncbi:unnamed protein product [Amoebophrya sp. A25]|nr:unnamed protein product [Amoebophrya sp. A25]|eukprot:GSA25T00000267001.1
MNGRGTSPWRTKVVPAFHCTLSLQVKTLPRSATPSGRPSAAFDEAPGSGRPTAALVKRVALCSCGCAPTVAVPEDDPASALVRFSCVPARRFSLRLPACRRVRSGRGRSCPIVFSSLIVLQAPSIHPYFGWLVPLFGFASRCRCRHRGVGSAALQPRQQQTGCGGERCHHLQLGRECERRHEAGHLRRDDCKYVYLLVDNCSVFIV